MGSGVLPAGAVAEKGNGRMGIGNLLVIGRILKTKGLRGKVKVLSYAESPEIYRRVREFHVQAGNDYQSLSVEEVEDRRDAVILKFKGRDRIEEAQELIGADLYVDKKDLPAPAEDEYYWHELIGLEVTTQGGTHLGTIDGIFSTGSNDVYVVREGKREILIPALRDVILKVDIPGHQMIIHPVEGLLDPHDL